MLQYIPTDMSDQRRDLWLLARLEGRMGGQYSTEVAERGDRHRRRRAGHNESHGRLHHRLDPALEAIANRYR